MSKEVKKLREYEAALLRAYQAYLRALLAALTATRRGKAPLAHGRIAVKCMAGLLAALPHFNYASDLLQALVPAIVHRDDRIRWV